PPADGFYREALDEGRAREGARRAKEECEVAANVPLIVTDDVESAAAAVKPMYALYFGGMGARGANFHANVPIRMGYEQEVAKIQDLYLSGHKAEAAAAVPTKLVEEITLIGSKEKIPDQLQAWRASIDTTRVGGGARRSAVATHRRSGRPPSSSWADAAGLQRRWPRSRVLVKAWIT